MIRLKIRQDFEKNRNITDLNIINMLLHKNQQEYQETMNCWKQEVSSVRVRKDGIGTEGSVQAVMVRGNSASLKCGKLRLVRVAQGYTHSGLRGAMISTALDLTVSLGGC